MLANKINATLAICSQILDEKDNVHSLIRIVDLFEANVRAEIPVEQQALLIKVYFNLRATPDSPTKHKFSLKLIRPDGESGIVIPEQETELKTNLPGTPLGINISIDLHTVPRFMGTHYLVLTVDGQDLAWTHFTLQPPVASSPGK